MTGQKLTEFKSKNINIKAEKNIKTDKLTIKFVEGLSGWKTTWYILFNENKIEENNFPKTKGIYSLVINYSDNLYYSEFIIYRHNPINENLEFYFYEENKRVFCRIKSENVFELNKEIVMNDFNQSEMKKMIDSIQLENE